MNLLIAREKLAKLNHPLLTLQDVLGVLNLGKTQTSRLLNQLVKAQALVKIKRGLWAWPNIEPLSIMTYLSSPYPSYISLQSALFYHGVIEQIPAIVYGVTLGRKQKVSTPFGIFSMHHINADLFGGFETHYNPYLQIATPEKALLDYVYLSRVEPQLFGKLPEVDMSRINQKILNEMINKLNNRRAQLVIKDKLKKIIS